MTTHDVIVIGGGSGGYAAARTAREAGADVAIVDPGPLGGLCILRGCMPSKALFRSSDIAAWMRRAGEFGLAPVSPAADLSAIIDRKARLVKEFADYRLEQLHDPRFTLYEAPARFRSPHEVHVGDQVLRGAAFVIATGSVPRRPALPGLDAVGYLTSDELLERRTKPDSLLVLGCGAVGVEFAQFFQRLGTQVTLLQRSRHILSDWDEDMARTLELRFREEGMTVYTGAAIRGFDLAGTQKRVTFVHEDRERQVSADLILQALGRRPNSDALELPAAGVATDDGRVVVDEEMRTSQPHIYAVGDVVNLYDVVHIAVQQGEVAGYNATHPQRTPRRMDYRLRAEVIFADPQLAMAGLTEKECRKKDIEYLAASYPFREHGKALCLGETHGHVKLMCDPSSGRLIGAQIAGPEAGELIHELIAVMYYHGTVQDLLRIPHYHPTLAEIVTYPAEELAAKVGAAT